MSIKVTSLPKLIGFCGYATCGKNTAAEELNKILKQLDIPRQYKIIGFADSLKGDIKPCIDFADQWGVDTKTKEFKELFRPMWVLWSRVAKAITGDKLIWVKRLFQLIETYNHLNFAICDVRYDYEVTEIINRGGLVIFITRPDVTYANDEEKQSFEEIFKEHPFMVERFTIKNDGAKEELGEKVWRILTKDGKN